MNRALANHSSLAGLCLLLALGTGCESPSQYVSPRITGRVLDEQTGQPIANARVQRWTAAPVGSMDPKKGAQNMDQEPQVFTDRDGTFVLQSQRSLAFFRDLGWYPVTLSFAHPKYEPMTFSYAEAPATNLPSGEPLVKTGDTRLKPLSK